MPGFEALAPDQKAVLQLLLKQGKTYDDIAGLLRLDRGNVRERALDALDALGADHEPQAGTLEPERQDELADHLLLQQTASERAATRTFLKASAPGRAWARSVAAELAPIAGGSLPDIPAEPTQAAAPVLAIDTPPSPDEPASTADRAAGTERPADSSRLGGVLLLAAIGAIIALAIVLLVRKGNDPKPVTQAGTTSNAAAATTATTATKGTGRCEIPALPTGTTDQKPIPAAIAALGTAKLQQQQINLKVPAGSPSKALGFAIISRNGLAFQAEGLKENQNGYEVWLWNTPQEAFPLGFAVYDRASKRYAGAIESLPASAENCGRLVLTRESGAKSATPGPIVLAGAIKQAGG